MPRIVLALLIFAPILVNSQTDWAHLRKKSHETFAYRIPADSAEKYIKQDSIPVDIFLKQQPVMVFKTESLDVNLLPKGHFVLIKVLEEKVEATLYSFTDLIVYPLLNEQLHLLEVRDKKGVFIADAKVWVNNKPAYHDKAALNFRIKHQKQMDEPFIKVIAANDTAFVSFNFEEPRLKVSAQKWHYFKSTKFGRVVTWLPRKVGNWFSGKYYYRSKSSSIGASGYMLFNQPKYKLTDTVKLKAYIVNKHWKQYKEKVSLHLQYYNRGKSFDQVLATITPSSASSYVYQFPLSDTLVNDVTYTIEIKTADSKKRILSSRFRVEDYVLDEVAKYNFRSQKETYYSSDSMVFFASAKDANDLPLLDAKAKLILLSGSVKKYSADSLYVADTLFMQEKTMDTNNDTKFVVSTSILPNAEQVINAILEFRNSNNEIQTKQVTLSYKQINLELRANIANDSIEVGFFKNNQSIEANGEMDINGENNVEQTIKVHYPLKVKIDPLAEDYTFTVLEKDSVIARKNVTIPNQYQVGFASINKGDTAGFVLNNPNKIPVTYIVFNGNRIVQTGKSSDAQIAWKQTMNKRRSFTVKYNYVWNGKAIEKSENIAVLHKMLNIEVQTSNQIFPGQQDTVHVQVTDYKGKPANHVNLTAASYNSQFAKSITVPDPPYLARYKQGQAWKKGYYKIDGDLADVRSKYYLGNHQAWRKKFGLDSLLFYKMLFPDSSIMDVATYNTSFMPQLSVHVVKQGQPQPIYMLYVNRQMVYADKATIKMPKSYQTNNNYTQIGIRLLDKYIALDSIYVQPNYKHDLVINLDKLPANCKVIEQPKYYTNEEIKLLENSLLQLDTRFYGAYIWQDWRVAKASTNYNKYQPQLVGPFINGGYQLNFFLPNSFDIQFAFEPGFICEPSAKKIRLEKNTIFPTLLNNQHHQLPIYKDYQWKNLGDTLLEPPIIEYKKIIPEPSLRLTYSWKMNEYASTQSGNGKLKFDIHKDSSLRYVVLVQKDSIKGNVFTGYTRAINNMPPGLYKLILIEKKWKVAEHWLLIKADTTLYVSTNNWVYKTNQALIDELSKEEEIVVAKPVATENKRDSNYVANQLPYYASGTSRISGRVMDEKGKNPIAYASVIIKGTKTGAQTDINGYYSITKIQTGKVVLQVSAIGYSTKEKIFFGDEMEANIELTPSQQNLEEVVVVGYGSVKRKDVTGSIAKISSNSSSLFQSKSVNLEYELAGRVAGLNITDADGAPGANTKITIRGISSLTPNSQPLYVIDGIAYDQMPSNINPDFIEGLEILKDASSIALYGARAANGVLIINTKAPALRTQFRDYAFWKPEFFTDKNGRASFSVTYPDNITGWETYVLGMDKKRRIGKAMKFVKSYKPMMAQLSTPQFLIEGDSGQLIGKVVNYTADTYTVNTNFSVDDKLLKENKTTVAGSTSVITPLLVIGNKDTLKTKFQLQTNTGFKDGEERKIPVFKKGTEEAIGNFWMLDKDTTIHFKASNQATSIEISAMNNTLDVLLNELDNLKKYPYFCMEQTASKLRGLVMEKKIRAALKQTFTSEKELNALISKLQKAQLFDGAWGWWENGKANVYITNYVLNALLPLRNNGLIESNVRNGLLFLQNQLPNMDRQQLLSSLTTMANAHHAMQYDTLLAKIPFDSLSVHQQWQYVSIKQQLHSNYKNELGILLSKSVNGMLGSMYWGEENYRWYSNTNATTVTAYEVLSKDSSNKHLTNNIIQYFLSERRNGYWKNTVESASIINAILPDVLSLNKDFNKPTSLQITGDTSFTISSFPFKKTFNNQTQNLQVQKLGGGITYLTLYQKIWNGNPKPVTDNFELNSYFEKNGRQVAYIKAGERLKMKVDIQVKKGAEYVMIEIPIPAGCIYASKNQDSWQMHKEFMKNKVLLFAEQLNSGIHHFEIELEPRYNGTYTLNPAKASLMYFPTFYGRNEMKQVTIKAE
jgi:TonB-dependent SusC/RagA subfamily outer membrane receptor